jgi:predicted phosphoribosyltransferase
MMIFKDRLDAGKQLSRLLEHYKNEDVVVYALPRGGVPVAAAIAKALNAPLNLLFAHKIGHPYQSEYAIAAISESGHLVGLPDELDSLNKEWLNKEKDHQLSEIQRKRHLYLEGKQDLPIQNKIAIVVDDGIATGLTMMAAVQELKDRCPKSIVIAVPVSPKETADLLMRMADEFVAVETPVESKFLGAVGAYYEKFDQVEDDEVISSLNKNT